MKTTTEIGYIIGGIVGLLLGLAALRSIFPNLLALLISPFYFILARRRITSLFNDLGMDAKYELTRLKDSGVTQYDVLEALNLSPFQGEHSPENIPKETMEAVIAKLVGKTDELRRRADDEIRETKIADVISLLADNDGTLDEAAICRLLPYKEIIRKWPGIRAEQLKGAAGREDSSKSVAAPARDQKTTIPEIGTSEDIEIPNDLKSLTVGEFEHLMVTLRIRRGEYQNWPFRDIERTLKTIKKEKKSEKLKADEKSRFDELLTKREKRVKVKTVLQLIWVIFVLIVVLRACLS